MKHWFCGLIALVLFLGMSEQGQAQPTYTFTTLDVPGLVSYSTTSALMGLGGLAN
jgi:hypothetical protein